VADCGRYLQYVQRSTHQLVKDFRRIEFIAFAIVELETLANTTLTEYRRNIGIFAMQLEYVIDQQWRWYQFCGFHVIPPLIYSATKDEISLGSPLLS
jgi:hypothetical protein